MNTKKNALKAIVTGLWLALGFSFYQLLIVSSQRLEDIALFIFLIALFTPLYISAYLEIDRRK